MIKTKGKKMTSCLCLEVSITTDPEFLHQEH